MQLYYFVERLYPYYVKEDTIMREIIKLSEQFCFFLRYVVSGETFRSLEYQFRVSRRARERIVERVTKAIVEELQDEYLEIPNTVNKCCKSQKNFHGDGTFLQ